MAPLLKELSNLEVEPLDVLVSLPESEQERGLDTLTTTPAEVEVAALLTGTLPVDDHYCCCCILCCCLLNFSGTEKTTTVSIF